MTSQIVVFDQLKKTALALSTKQRITLAACAAVTLMTLLAFVHLIGKREMKPLFTDLEAQDAQRLSSELAAKSIPFEQSSDGKSISVPADKVDAARLEVATQGMPHSGRLGFELFDKVSWGQTEFDEKVNYQRAMEGELERTIQTMKDVQSVRVHLVMPTDSVFLTRERPAKASVIVKTQHGELSESSQTAISRLVAGAVDSLTPENVTVIDADTNMPMQNARRGHWIADEEQEHALLARLMSTLGPVLGPDHVRATVDVEYDPSTVEENQDSYDPDSQVAINRQTSEEQTGPGALASANGGNAGGIPGTSSNIPGKSQTAAAAQSNDGHMSKTDAATFAVNRVTRHTLQPAGRIRRITAAIAVDDMIVPGNAAGQYGHRRWTPEELTQVQQLAQDALGIDTTRGDHLSIQNVSFDRPLPAAQVKLSPVQRVRTTMQDWSTAVRYGSLLLLFVIAYFLMLRPVKKEVIATFKSLVPQVAVSEIAAVPAPAVAGEAGGQLSDMFSEETQNLKKLVIERVKKDPAPTGRLIQSWINEDAQ